MFCKKCKTLIDDAYNFCPVCGKETRPEVKAKSRRPNKTGYIRKRGNAFQLEIVVGKKTVTKGGFSTKGEAAAYAETLKSLTGTGKKKKTTTIRMLWDNFSCGEMLKLSVNKQSHYNTAFEKISKIADASIKEISIEDLQSVVNESAETYYPARDIKNLLSHFYKRAVAQQDVNTNLSQFIVLPELEEKEPFPFSENDIKVLWKDYASGNNFTGYILLMIYSGMMPGELFKCTKSMVNWSERKIVGCGLKTKKRKETPLLIADFMVPVIQDLCEYSKTEKLLSVKPDNFYKEFHAVLERCKIKDRTPYACRHTTATALAFGNVAPLVIQEIMRHKKFSTTEKYIHLESSNAPMLLALDALR